MTAEPKPAKKILRILLDANALFVPLKFKLDIFEELETLINGSFELILLSPIKKELERLATDDSTKIRKNALYALNLAEKCRLVEVNQQLNTTPDDIILKVAGEWNCPVFTNDKKLRRKLRDINVPVIYVRQKSRLEIDGRR
jgi:rRNA-processing protein FCF1